MITLFGLGLASLASVATAKSPCADEASQAENTAELKAWFEEGEARRAERAAGDKAVLKEDEKRAKLMTKYDAKGWLCTPQDKWYAAWMMQQHDKLEVIERSYELAVEAMEARVDRGPWLVAFAHDHKRTLAGYRQSYGTQTRRDRQGRLCLIELDGEISDRTRQQYGVMTLPERYRRVLDANGFANEEATELRMKRKQLICEPVAVNKKDQRRVDIVQ